ncbi:MAG TPA: PilZ domain-containing protein [bacterium]|nr:PilZ domain-containing protein [bacterium]
MNKERRIFERENVAISIIYSLDDGVSMLEGEWFEAQTIDIGPVLVGGISFYTERKIEPGRPIRLALFMDLQLKESWSQESESFPIYKGKVLRVSPHNRGYKVAVEFQGFAKEHS